MCKSLVQEVSQKSERCLRSYGIFLCQIFHLIEGESPHPEIVEDARKKYSLCLNFLYDFSQLWVSASLIHRLFDTLQCTRQPFLHRGKESKGRDGRVETGPPGSVRLTSDFDDRDMRQ